jgi:hypothetical protein
VRVEEKEEQPQVACIRSCTFKEKRVIIKHSTTIVGDEKRE